MYKEDPFKDQYPPPAPKTFKVLPLIVNPAPKATEAKFLPASDITKLLVVKVALLIFPVMLKAGAASVVPSKVKPEDVATALVPLPNKISLAVS